MLLPLTKYVRNVYHTWLAEDEWMKLMATVLHSTHLGFSGQMLMCRCLSRTSMKLRSTLLLPGVGLRVGLKVRAPSCILGSITNEGSDLGEVFGPQSDYL